MSDHSLHDIYTRVLRDYQHVFVVPLIRFDFPKSDYLYLLYATLIHTESDVNFHSTSALGHYKFLIAQLFGRKPILHYHWLEFQDIKSLIGIIYKVKMLWLYKLFGGKLVWSIHNIKPHDGRWISAHRRLHKWMAQQSDRILVHSAIQIETVSKYYSVSPDKFVVFPHPVFPAEILDRSTAIVKIEQKFDLTIDRNAQNLGSFGAISEYKNLVKIVTLLDEINFKGTYFVFGYVKKGQEKYHKQLQKLSEKYTWFKYRPGFVAEVDIPVIMSLFDLCVFNFRDINTSGAIELARSYQKKIIAPDKGLLKELKSDVNVHLFSNEDEFKSILTSLLD